MTPAQTRPAPGPMQQQQLDHFMSLPGRAESDGEREAWDDYIDAMALRMAAKEPHKWKHLPAWINEARAARTKETPK